MKPLFALAFIATFCLIFFGTLGLMYYFITDYNALIGYIIGIGLLSFIFGVLIARNFYVFLVEKFDKNKE